jgi:regulator of protease activity HflC (stomatin/prohibitin superfamily)
MTAGFLAHLLVPLFPVLAPLVGTLTGIRFIQESERGVKLRWGRVVRRRNGTVKIKNPGFLLLIPTMHKLRRTHVRTWTLVLDPQHVMLQDHTVFNVGALVICRVINTSEGIYAALFEVSNMAASVEAYCAATLRDVLLGITHRALADPDALASEVRDRVRSRLAEWGIEIMEVKVTDCSPTPETARLMLIEAEAGFKVEALNRAVSGLDEGCHQIAPTLAAALIGMPVSVAVGAEMASANGRAPRTRSAGQPAKDDSESDD